MNILAAVRHEKITAHSKTEQKLANKLILFKKNMDAATFYLST